MCGAMRYALCGLLGDFACAGQRVGYSAQIVFRHRCAEWIPPPHLDHGQPRINTFHHPENLLCESNDEDDP